MFLPGMLPGENPCTCPDEFQRKTAERLSAVFQGMEHGIARDLLAMEGLSSFASEVLEAVASIPAGMTSTYGAIATELGRPGAARAVGRVLAANPFPLLVPCHRVTGVSGSGGYQGGTEMKLFLLERERGTCQVKGNTLL